MMGIITISLNLNPDLLIYMSGSCSVISSYADVYYPLYIKRTVQYTSLALRRLRELKSSEEERARIA